MSECECRLPGWCERHQRVKTQHLHKLCQTDQRYRDVWDKQTPSKEPGLVQKAWSYAKAVARWKVAGEPTRSKDEVNHIFETQCRPCQHFVVKKDGNGSCKLCGCKLSKLPEGLKNKIAMATESCPIGRWVSRLTQPLGDQPQ